MDPKLPADDFFRELLKILPEAVFTEDGDGQLLMHTGYKIIEEDGKHVAVQMEERD